MRIYDINRPYKPVFLTEEEIKYALKLMEQDATLKTAALADGYSGHLVPFIDKHAGYLRGHPKVNPEFYLANLRTMIKIRLEK